MKWVPEQWWAGRDAFVIGGGPSLCGFDWDRLRGQLAVGCNDAYLLGPSVCTVCVFGDLKWFNTHRERLEKFPNPIITNQPSLNVGSPSWVLTMPRERRGLHRTVLGWNGNTGALGVNVALVLGAVRVFLLGFDMKLGNTGRPNWHSNNIGKPNAGTYDRFKKAFESVRDDLPGVFPGRQIINLGPDSDLAVFPKGNLDDYL